MISDHLPQLLIVNNFFKKEISFPQEGKFIRDWKCFNSIRFISKICEMKWDSVLDLDVNGPNKSFNSFYSTIVNLLGRHVSLKKMCSKKALNLLLGLLMESAPRFLLEIDCIDTF